MANRRPFVRTLIGFGASCCAFLALAGVIVLHGAPLVAVAAAAVLVACLTHCAQEGGGPAAMTAAWRAAVWTVSVLMVAVGIAVLAGAAVAALSTGLAAVSVGAVRLGRAVRARSAGRPVAGSSVAENGTGVAPTPRAGRLDRPAPVSLVPTSVLGNNWVRTTAAMAFPLDADVWQSLVERRREILDELERRDPAGFTGWLASGNAWDSDPAGFVRTDRATGTDAA